jgi:hypothetical protein
MKIKVNGKDVQHDQKLLTYDHVVGYVVGKRKAPPPSLHVTFVRSTVKGAGGGMLSPGESVLVTEGMSVTGVIEES